MEAVLSWMIGVAGTRQVLEVEEYRWIAPLSAFYPNAKQAVAIEEWPFSFPQAVLCADKRPASRVRLRPDYVAVRSSTLGAEWAVVESKGTDASLKNMSACPHGWHQQARNIEITADGVPIVAPRHLVVATRANQNASPQWTVKTGQ